MKNRVWQRMLSGRRLDLLNPSPLDIEIEDIAHGLAFLARWNGQTIGSFPYSVAEHSLLVEKLFSSRNPTIPTQWRLAALIHDAAEYVIGDMISPVKNKTGADYEELETQLTKVINTRFGLPSLIPSKIKKKIIVADKSSAWYEAVQIAGFSENDATKVFGKPMHILNDKVLIEPLAPVKARTNFLKQFHILTNRE